jgi:polyisoprenoid-binding protein YceI
MRGAVEPVGAFSPGEFLPETAFSQDDQSGEYVFDKNHSFIGFRIKHMGLIEVPGYFRDFTGTINYDAKNAANSSVNFTAKVTSVDTGVQARDNHLRTKDFFEVETYPDMTFKSTKVERSGNNFTVTGDLTIKGVTKQVSFPFQLAGFAPDRRGLKMGVTAGTQINRRDFGVNYGGNMSNGVPTLADQVTVWLQIEAGKRQAQPAASPAQ